MKTAISIPDDVFDKAERFARQAGRSRSELFSAAVAEYIARHAADEVTDAMNRVCDEIDQADSAFAGAAARQVLRTSEW